MQSESFQPEKNAFISTPVKDELYNWDGDILDNQSDSNRQLSSEDDAITCQSNKPIRVSKKDIPDYKWSEEGERRLARFIKHYPELYDKRQKNWLNLAAKTSLWIKIGEQLDPPATHPQCKKHYENMRTRVGKIIKRERTRGVKHPPRSVRDQRIMETWSFLKQHIGRPRTLPEEHIIITKRVAYSTSSEDDEDEEVQSVRHQAPISTLTGKEKRKRPVHTAPPTRILQTSTAIAATANATSTTGNTPIDAREAIRQILYSPDFMNANITYSGHQRIVHNFACLLEGHMQGIPEESWHNFQIDCLNLVHRYKQGDLSTCQ